MGKNISYKSFFFSVFSIFFPVFAYRIIVGKKFFFYKNVAQSSKNAFPCGKYREKRLRGDFDFSASVKETGTQVTEKAAVFVNHKLTTTFRTVSYMEIKDFL